MKKIRFLHIFFCLVCFSISTVGDANSDESYIMGDVDTLPADFFLDVTVVAEADGVVNKLATFIVKRADDSTLGGKYDISFFRDNTFVRMFSQKPLPFQLKRNFWGTRDGDYRLTFVAKDEAGKIGKGSVNIRVRH